MPSVYILCQGHSSLQSAAARGLKWGFVIVWTSSFSRRDTRINFVCIQHHHIKLSAIEKRALPAFDILKQSSSLVESDLPFHCKVILQPMTFRRSRSCHGIGILRAWNVAPRAALYAYHSKREIPGHAEERKKGENHHFWETYNFWVEFCMQKKEFLSN